MSNEAQMKLIGSHGGVNYYWAEPGRFEIPGVYYWDGKRNVNLIIAEAELAEVREQLRRAMDEASTLAMSMWKTFYKDSAPEFELCDNPASIISQIDNMYSGLRAELERVNGLLSELVEIADQKMLRFYGKIREGSPNHRHDIPGVWDSDNGALAGKPCAECAIYDKARSAIDAARGVEG